MMTAPSSFGAGFILFALAACGPQTPPPVRPAPTPADGPGAARETEAAAPRVESEFSLADRWGSPFAVSSAGRIAPRTPREVTVVGMDSTIAAGVARLRPPVRVREMESVDEGRVGEADEEGGREREGGTEREDGGARLEGSEREGAGDVVRSSGSSEDPAGADSEAGRDGGTAAAARAPRASDTVEAAANSGAARTHRVGPGDTLWGIARRYNVDPERIRRVNGMSDDRVRLGETLVIPE